MTIEIERKFIVAELPPAERLGTGVEIRQGYVAEDAPVEVRLRITSTASTLTVKAGSGLARTEVDVAISAEQAEALWPHTAGRRVEKTRHRVALGQPSEVVAEVDIYAGTLSGLCVVEVEFDSEVEAAAFDPPAWFGRELTDEAGWNNAALARHGRPA